MNFSTEIKYDKLIKAVLIATVITLLILPFGVFALKINFLNDILTGLHLNGINLILGLMSIPCCILYYYLYKNKEFFILTLSYISIFIEYYFINNYLVYYDGSCFSDNCIYANDYFLYLGNMILSPFLIRIILLTIAIFYNSKISQFILSNKKLAIIITALFNVLLVLGEIFLRERFIGLFSSNYMDLLNLLVVIYYSYLLFILAKRCVKKSEFIYTIFILSISIFTLRRLFALSIFSNINQKAFLYNKFLSFIGFLVLLVGLFYEIIFKAKESQLLNAEIESNEITLLTITENIKDLIFETDLDGKIIFVNQAVVSSLGYTKKEIIGLDFNTLVHSEYNKLYNEEKTISYVEQRLKCKDGNLLVTETVLNNVISFNGDVVGQIIAARDCSFREQFERLRKKYDEVKELESIRTQFFANLSHEIRTPINIIYSCFQLLESKSSGNKEELLLSYSKYSSTIKQNCFRLLRLVNNLIDITKIDSGFLSITPSNVDIVNLIENITLSIVPYVESKNINVVFDTYIEELIIKCDPESIERIMLNLLSNAVKFTNANGNIFVQINSTEKFVIIKVKDDGIGIPTEFKDSIFDRFIQTNKSLHREKEGSGIGLALVKSLIELHSGTIYVENVPTGGSIFTIKLPNLKLDESTLNNTNSKIPNNTMEKVSLEFSDIYDLT